MADQKHSQDKIRNLRRLMEGGEEACWKRREQGVQSRMFKEKRKEGMKQ